MTINDNNFLSKIILKCNAFINQIDFVYADYQTISLNYGTTSFITQYTIDFVNKEIVSIGHWSGGVIDMLEFCTRDLTTRAITCTKGCTEKIPNKIYQIFDFYEIVAFTVDWGWWANAYAVTTFGIKYIVIL